MPITAREDSTAQAVEKRGSPRRAKAAASVRYLDDDNQVFFVRFGPTPVAVAGRVLDEQDVTCSEVSDLTVAGLDTRSAAEVDEKLPPWRWVPIALPAGGRGHEADSRGRDEVRDMERRRGRGKIHGFKGNLDILEVRFPVRAGVESNVSHRSRLQSSHHGTRD